MNAEVRLPVEPPATEARLPVEPPATEARLLVEPPAPEAEADEGFVEVARLADLEPDQPLRVTAAGVPLLLVRTGPAVFALAATCTHEEADLDSGIVEDGCIECPRHGARFDLRSGAALTLPATRDLATYPMRIDEGRILVSPHAKPTIGKKRT